MIFIFLSIDAALTKIIDLKLMPAVQVQLTNVFQHSFEVEELIRLTNVSFETGFEK